MNLTFSIIYSKNVRFFIFDEVLLLSIAYKPHRINIAVFQYGHDCLADGAPCTPGSQCCIGNCRDFYDDAHLNPPCPSSTNCYAGLPPPCCICYNF